MAICNNGAIIVASALLGDGGTPLINNANAYIGLGDSATAFSASQTDLQAGSNKVRKAMDATYPQRSSNVLTLRSTFTTADANFTIAEYGTFNASSGATSMLTRKVDGTLGTKTSAQTWVVTVTLTIQAA